MTKDKIEWSYYSHKLLSVGLLNKKVVYPKKIIKKLYFTFCSRNVTKQIEIENVWE